MSTGHDELQAQAAPYVLGSLEPDERRAFQAHLATCAACADEVRSLSSVVHGLAQAVPQRTPPAALRERVLSQVGAAAGSAAAPARMSERRPRGAGPEANAGSKDPAYVGLVDPAYVREDPAHVRVPAARDSSSWAWLPLAAMLLLTLGMGAYVLQLRGRLVDLEARLDRALQDSAIAESAVADARRVSLENQSAMAVLAAPDLARIDLAGQPSAPRASARALWSRERGMVFTATQLPALPPGKVYQVWVVTAQSPISAGLLVPDADGRAVAVFNTPSDIPAPVAVAVTIEPDGGVPAPTGDKYLVGVPG